MALYIPIPYPSMISLEKQVVSLELAKQLKELGVRQESLFWWRARPGNARYDNDPAARIKWFVADLPFKLEWAEKQYAPTPPLPSLH